MENNSLFSSVPKNVFTVLMIFLAVLTVKQIFSISNEIKKSRYIGQEFERIHTIVVEGQGRVEVKPDIAEVTISVVTRDKDIKKAQNENTYKNNSIIKFLTDQNIKKEDIKTISYNIYPQYDYSQGGRKFLGYEVRNSLNVKIRDFEKIGIIVDKVVELGANEVSGLNFLVDNKEVIINQARQKAINDAKSKAQILADQLGVILVRITNFSESPYVNYHTPRYLAERTFGKDVGVDVIPQTEPGQTDIVSNVAITYEIATK